MDNKTLSIVSYITIIGWLISYFSGKDTANSLLKYHLRQSLALFIFGVAFNIVFAIIVTMVPSLYFLGYIGYAFWALIIIGIINANNEVEKPLPVIGKWAEKQFAFIG